MANTPARSTTWTTSTTSATGDLGDLGGSGDREEEYDDRQQALDRRDDIGRRHAGSTSRTQGARALVGSFRRVSKASATTSRRAGTERGVAPTVQS